MTTGIILAVVPSCFSAFICNSQCPLDLGRWDCFELKNVDNLHDGIKVTSLAGVVLVVVVRYEVFVLRATLSYELVTMTNRLLTQIPEKQVSFDKMPLECLLERIT